LVKKTFVLKYDIHMRY